MFAGLIILLTLSTAYYIEHKEITSPNDLISRAVDASKGVDSYGFVTNTKLSMASESNDLLESHGYLNYRDEKLFATVLMDSRSLDILVRGDEVYLREEEGPWQVQRIDGKVMWANYDQLSEQCAFLSTAENVTMEKVENGWVLEVKPERAEIIKELKRAGLDFDGEKELQAFRIRYRIEKDSYRITEIEEEIELSMNVMGLVTPVNLKNSVSISGYNEEVEFETPRIASGEK